MDLEATLLFIHQWGSLEMLNNIFVSFKMEYIHLEPLSVLGEKLLIYEVEIVSLSLQDTAMAI